MENKNKSIVINCLCAIAFFFALMGLMQLTTNTFNLILMRNRLELMGLEYRYTQKFYITVCILCIVAVIISLVGLIFFIQAFFSKKNFEKKKQNISLIITESINIFCFILLSIIIWFTIPTSRYENKIQAYDFELCTQIQGLFIQQIVTFAVLLGINIYQAFAKKKNIDVDNG